MAITTREPARKNLDFSQVSNEGLQTSRASDEAYEKMIRVGMSIESNTPQQQTKNEARLAEVMEHRAALVAETSSRQPKPAAQLSNAAIVTEVKELHAQFKHLSEEYKQSPTPQLREEMKPVVARENELRQEYTGRATQELSRDRVPVDVGYSR